MRTKGHRIGHSANLAIQKTSQRKCDYICLWKENGFLNEKVKVVQYTHFCGPLTIKCVSMFMSSLR